MKPDNVLIEWKSDHDGINVSQVQLSGLEEGVHLPPSYHLYDKLVGHFLWRSPEGHAQGLVNTPSDMFSFGLVVRRYQAWKLPILESSNGD